MITIIFNTILTNIILFSYGVIFIKYFCKEKLCENNIHEVSLFGIIFLSFTVLLLNFFFSINKIIGTGILVIGLFILLNEFIKNNSIKKEIIKIISISSLISFILIVYSNIYRPDAGLYHLPFISIINENKIIIGSANIHFRFATTSIVQYLSSSQNNFIYDLKSLSIPIASIFSFFLVYSSKEILINYQLKKISVSLIIFLITAFCLIGFGRFSNYGNDTVSHIYYFILVIFLLNNFKNIKYDINKLNKLSSICLFLFASKAFMSLLLLLPIIFFVFHNKKKEIIKNNFFYLNLLFVVAWLLKSLLISGCLIYPINKTCLGSLMFYDEDKTIHEARSGEAWAKDWINQKENKLQYDEYNKNFNWIDTWKKNHFKKIIEKISPFIFFLFLFLITIIFQKKKDYEKIPIQVHLIFFFSFLLSIIWFLKFPLYRYGTAFLVTTMILTFFYLIHFLKIIPENKILYKNFKIFLCICFLAIITKNFLRIYENINTYNNNYWPDIYSEKNDGIINNFEKIKKEDKTLYYYSKGKLCMYSKSPCSNYKIKNLNKKKILFYDLYWVSNK